MAHARGLSLDLSKWLTKWLTANTGRIAMHVTSFIYHEVPTSFITRRSVTGVGVCCSHSCSCPPPGAHSPDSYLFGTIPYTAQSIVTSEQVH